MRCKILCVTTGQLRCKCASDEVELFVRDHLSHGGDPLLDSLDLFRPRAACVVGIGNAGGIFAFGLGEVFKKVIEFLLECRAAHGNRLSGVGVRGVRLIRSAGHAPVPCGHWCVTDRRVGGESRVDDCEARAPLEVGDQG